MNPYAGTLSRQTLDHLQNRVTMNGWLLFLIGLSLVGSGFMSTRVVIAGLSASVPIHRPPLFSHS